MSHTALQSLKLNYKGIPLKTDGHRNPEGSQRANSTLQGVSNLRYALKIINFISNQLTQRREEQAGDMIYLYGCLN